MGAKPKMEQFPAVKDPTWLWPMWIKSKVDHKEGFNFVLDTWIDNFAGRIRAAPRRDCSLINRLTVVNYLLLCSNQIIYHSGKGLNKGFLRISRLSNNFEISLPSAKQTTQFTTKKLIFESWMIIWHFNEKTPPKKMFRSRKGRPCMQILFHHGKNFLRVLFFFRTYQDEKKR